MDSRKATAARNRRSAPQRQTPLKFNRTSPGVLDLSKNTCSGATSSLPVYGVSGLRDTSMDLGSGGGAVLFSVNPPSPLESEYYSDDQESILRTWHTEGTSTFDVLGADESGRNRDPVTFEPAAMDHGIKGCQGARSAQSKSLKSTVTSLPTGSAETLSKGSKRAQGRRSSTSEPNRKTELYKTEMCISVSSGAPCRYGDNCQFAHSTHELNHVNRHPRYKTQLCTSFQRQGYCKYNDRCTFIHNLEEARTPLSPSVARSGRSSTSTWSSSSSSESTPDSRVVTPVPSGKRESRSERQRAKSDPGIAFKDPLVTVEESSSLVCADSSPPKAFVPRVSSVHALPTPEGRARLLQGSELSWAMFLRRNYGRTMAYSGDCTQDGGGIQTSPPMNDRVTFAVSPPCESYSNSTPVLCQGLREIAFVPDTTTAVGRTSSLGNILSAADVNVQAAECDEAELEVDMEWYSSLGHFISTPQNDFAI
ncbi:hypothetical protein BGZ70_010217 [Mortierella alpina]|uniref:C3H1-type domain-containing protein n=1 Tax=Mortierella alpina TaxID=64518 RepID=A0A9P6M5K0_MORAP|nr:hypothetical protein BGZ70_010217 [Mortierella alpina]